MRSQRVYNLLVEESTGELGRGEAAVTLLIADFCLSA